MNRLKKVLGAGLIVAAVVAILAPTASTAEPGASRSKLSVRLAAASAATAKYVNDLPLAKKNGYRIITKLIPAMGYHFMNPAVKGFDITKPPILVYEHQGSSWQLGAIEWVFTSKPRTPPLPGARYGAFGAGCHYADGTYVPAASPELCPANAPGTGAKFGFWHPNLVTMHVWLWYPNPLGLYSSTNPLVAPFNKG